MKEEIEMYKELVKSMRKDTIAEMRALDVATLPERGVLEQKIRKEVEDGLIKYADSYIENKDFNRIWFKAHINLGMESLSKGVDIK